MPPSKVLAVVLEVRENGDRLAWDFSKRQESVIAARVGRVAEWLQIDGEDVSATQALVATSDVDIKPLSGKHIMLKVPAIKLPDIEGDLGIGVSADRTKRFYSPLVGPIDAFFNTSQFPANVLLELEVIKVPTPLKSAVKAKAGYEPEWMFREQPLKEITREMEAELSPLLEQLNRARAGGVVVSTVGTSHVVVSESDDGQRQLYAAQGVGLRVGHLVSFLPIDAPFTSSMKLAASCRTLSPDFLVPIEGGTNEFRASSAAVELESGRYRLSHLGWVADPNGCIASAEGHAENVIFAMDLNLKTAQIAFTALSSVAATNEKVRIIRQESLESSEGSFTDESGSGKVSSKAQLSNGGVKKTTPQQLNAPWMNKPKSLEPKEYTLSAECSMQKGDEIIFKCDADNFDRSLFTCKIQTFQRVTRGKEPITGQWYELKLRFFTKRTTDLPRADVTYVKAIDPPETPYASSRPVQEGTPTSSVTSAAPTIPRSVSSTSIGTPGFPKTARSSAATSDKDEGPNEYTLSARVTDIKGEEAFFECPAAGFRPSSFICKTKFVPVSPSPTVGQWYELRLTFSERSLKDHAKPHVYVSRAKLIPKPVAPYYSCRTRQLNGSQSASPAPTGASGKPKIEYGAKGDQLSEAEQLVVLIVGEMSDMYKLCAPKKFQSPSNAYFHTKKFCFKDQSPVLGAWYCMKVKFANPGYAYVSDVKKTSPLMPTRILSGTFEIQTRLTPSKPLDGIPCGVSEELGRVVDIDGIAGSAFKGSSWSSIDCWCTRRDYTSDSSIKASWKVVSLVGSDTLSTGMSKLSVQDGSTAGPSSSAPKNAIAKKGCTGVVCYKEGDLCYVYSPQLGCEALLEHPPSSIEAGQWLEFSATLGDDKEYLAVDYKEIKPMFTSSPMFRSVVIECEVMVPMRVDETDRTVSSNFIGGIRDVYGLVGNVGPGVHKATIRYIYEEGSPSGYWQLEYIRVKKAS